MEVFSYHSGLKKWVEIGNSGIFRPEMLLPMGLPKDVSVIAWGLSLERFVCYKICFKKEVHVTCMPILVGMISPVLEILLPSKTGKFPFPTMDYSPWSSKNSIDQNRLKKFMQV